MSPASWLKDIDWDWTSKFLVVVVAFGGLMRWLFMPMIEKTLRTVFKAEIDKLNNTCDRSIKTSDRMDELLLDFQDLRQMVELDRGLAQDNREWLIEMNALLNAAGFSNDRRMNPRPPRRPE